MNDKSNLIKVKSHSKITSITTCIPNYTALVAVENTAYSFDKPFSYLIPKELCGKVQPGCRVLVPFAKGDRTRKAMVLSVEESIDTQGLKEINFLLDDKPVLTSELIKLAYFIKDRYFCTLYDAVKVMLPSGLNYSVKEDYAIADGFQPEMHKFTRNEEDVVNLLLNSSSFLSKEDIYQILGIKTESNVLKNLEKRQVIKRRELFKRKIGDLSEKYVRLKQNETVSKLTPKQKAVFELLENVHEVSVKEICYFTGVTPVVIEGLVKKGYAQFFQKEKLRTPKNKIDFKTNEVTELNEEQKKAYNDLYIKYKLDKPSVSLLYGVTGSGKTAVFMQLIDVAYKENRGIIMMVPEIALTPNMIAIFKNKYGNDVAVFHSGLSVGERLDEWRRTKRGDAKIVVGTRSAVFAPVKNLGLIIMDEEQEYSYKSESVPRYHARDVAKKRCAINNCLLLLSSATPNVESFYYANNERYSLSTLKNRFGKSKLPEVVIADMNQEVSKGNYTGYSDALLEGIEENIKAKRQSIILLNRRGHNTFATCRSCNEAVSCPNCSISLTYHSANNSLMCHYCGFSMPFKDVCPTCNNNGIKLSGMGTQGAQKGLEEIFPNARILRMDTDTTMNKNSHAEKLSLFQSGEYDILVGTQMVAKGLDFPNVTLAGVLSADQMLYSDDYRSYERAFSLLTQVVGRSGRGDYPGRAIIQTFTPENPVIMLASQQNYDKFFESEILVRKMLLYPPFADICMIGFVGQNDGLVFKSAVKFTNAFCKRAKEEYPAIPLRVLGPSWATVKKVSGKYRCKTIMKFRNSKEFRMLMSSLLKSFGNDRSNTGVSAYIDINPDMIL